MEFSQISTLSIFWSVFLSFSPSIQNILHLVPIPSGTFFLTTIFAGSPFSNFSVSFLTSSSICVIGKTMFTFGTILIGMTMLTFGRYDDVDFWSMFKVVGHVQFHSTSSRILSKFSTIFTEIAKSEHRQKNQPSGHPQ